MNFLALNIVDFLITYSWQIITIIATLISLLGAYTFYKSEKPKPTSDTVECTYIDAETLERIERHIIGIDWGPIFFMDKMTLREISKNSSIEVSYLPLADLEANMPDDCYSEKPAKNSKKVLLRKRRFFIEERIHTVALLIRTPIGSDFFKNISVDVIQMGNISQIVVKNENSCEVRNYRFVLRKDIPLERILASGHQIDNVIIEIPVEFLPGLLNTKIKDSHKTNIPVQLEIESIPPRREVVISLSS